MSNRDLARYGARPHAPERGHVPVLLRRLHAPGVGSLIPARGLGMNLYETTRRTSCKPCCRE